MGECYNAKWREGSLILLMIKKNIVLLIIVLVSLGGCLPVTYEYYTVEPVEDIYSLKINEVLVCKLK
jgi:hypothetical protein